MNPRGWLLPILAICTFSVALAEPLGDVMTAGTTWYDSQQLGSSGRMLAADETGSMHLNWTNSMNDNLFVSHIFYNVWNPADNAFLWDGGLQVDAVAQASYVTQATAPDGRSYPLFNGPQTVQCAIDFLPLAGAYSNSSVCVPAGEEALHYPMSVLDSDGKLHVLAAGETSNSLIGTPSALYYLRGQPNIDESGFGISIDWENPGGHTCATLLDSVAMPGYELVADHNSSRLAVVWVKARPHQSLAVPFRNNDLYYATSDDGGENWSAPVNITNFEEPDWDCASGNLHECNRDTFRVFTDVSALFDADNMLHVAFTTTMFYALEDTVSQYAAQLWHWDEGDQLYSPIRTFSLADVAPEWIDEPADFQTALQRPVLSIDPVSGDLFCAYEQLNPDEWTELGAPQGDLWVSRSTDGGIHWSTGINVSETDGGQGAALGNSLHEREINAAERIVYENSTGYLYLMYVLDRDGGCSLGENPTGAATENSVMLQRIAINDIPTAPLVDACSPQLHVDGSGSPCIEHANRDRPEPERHYELGPNYPNPFNPETTIRFSLDHSAQINLTVYDALGREVRTLLQAEPLTPGSHFVSFDGRDLPSGIYFYTLQTGTFSKTRKMVLLK